MAGEIRVQSSLEVIPRSDGTSSFRFPKAGGLIQAISQTTPGIYGPGTVAAVNTGQGTALTLTGIVSNGVAYIKNTSPTLSADFGPLVAGTLHPCIRLKPGEEYVFRLVPGSAYNIRGVTATTPVTIYVLDD